MTGASPAPGSRRTGRKKATKVNGTGPPHVAGPEPAVTELRQEIKRRRRAEAALRASHERYRSLFENVPVALAEIDLSLVRAYLGRLSGQTKDFRDSLWNNPGAAAACLGLIKLVDVNKAMLALFGLNGKGHEGPRWEMFGPHVYNLLRDCLDALTEGQTTFVADKVRCTLAGQTKYIRAALAVAPGSEDTWARLLVSLRDITGYIELHEHLELHNAILRLFLDAASQDEFLDRAARLFYQRAGCRCLGIRVLDENGNMPFIWQEGFSPEFLASESQLSIKRDCCACVRILAGSDEAQDVPALTPGGSFHCEDLAGFWESLTPGQKCRYRGVCVRSGLRTMALIPIKYGGQAMGLIHIADETKGSLLPGKLLMFESAAPLVAEALYRFRVEQNSQRNEALLAEAQRIAHVGHWEWAINGDTLIWSDEMYRIFGLPPQQSGATVEAFLASVHPDDADFVRKTINEALYQSNAYDIDYRIVRPDGLVRMVHGKGEVAFGENGKPVKMVGTVHDITEHKLAEEQLRGLSARLVEIQEEERRTIARDLHDQVGQSLTMLSILAEQALRLVSDARALTLIKDAKALTKELTNQVREISLNLRPSILDDLGLLPALLWHFERFTARTKIEVHFEHAELDADLPGALRTTAYRIVQEALNNVARYAKVNDVYVRAFTRDNTLLIEVEDHGVGFEPETIVLTSNGISGMEERARVVGGALTVDSSPGFGTCVALELPIPGRRTSGGRPGTQKK